MIRFLSILAFCLLPLAVWLWDYFTGQRSERVNASRNKARLLDGSKTGIGIPAPKGLVIGVTHYFPSLSGADGGGNPRCMVSFIGLCGGENPLLAGNESHAAKTPLTGKYCTPDSLCGSTESDLSMGTPVTRHSISANVGRGRSV